MFEAGRAWPAGSRIEDDDDGGGGRLGSVGGGGGNGPRGKSRRFRLSSGPAAAAVGPGTVGTSEAAAWRALPLFSPLLFAAFTSEVGATFEASRAWPAVPIFRFRLLVEG